MICLKKNIFIVLMIIVNFMSFNRVMAPNNEGFEECYTQLQNAFFLVGNEQFMKPDSPIYCIRNAIKYLSENDENGSDLQEYYSKFPGRVNGDKIMNRKSFCVEVTDDILDPAAMTHPAKYYDEHFKPPKSQITPSMFLFKLFRGTSRDKDEEIEECVRDLVVFGSPIASNDEILDLALRKFRITSFDEKLDYVFLEGTYKYQYLVYISEVVTLKDDHDPNLVTPWDYCCERYPDKGQENAKLEDEASSRNNNNFSCNIL